MPAIIFFFRLDPNGAYFVYITIAKAKKTDTLTVLTTISCGKLIIMYTAIPNKINPVNILKSFIQRPGLGIRPESLLLNDKRTYGKAIPAPIDVNTVKITRGVCVIAQARVAPRRGPLHGVAMTVVNIPLKKSPNIPDPLFLSS